MPAVPDFEDLVKQINATASAKKVAAATIALRLVRAQASGGSISDLPSVFADPNTGANTFKELVDKIDSAVSGL